MRLEIFLQVRVARLRNIARLGRTERHIRDRTLLVLERIDGVEPRRRHRNSGGQRVADGPAQHHLPLLGDEALLGVAGAAQELLELDAVELAGRVLERLVAGDALDDFGVGNREPHLARPLIERGLGHHLAEHPSIEADRLGLLGRDRPAGLAAELLHAVVVGLPERLDRDFGAADLGERRAAEATENVVDAPDREARGEEAHDHGHDRAAEPIGGGVADTSKHSFQR